MLLHAPQSQVGTHGCRQGALGINTASCAKGTYHLGNAPSLRHLCVLRWLHVAVLPALPVLHGHCCLEHGSPLWGRCEMAQMWCGAGVPSSLSSLIPGGVQDAPGQMGLWAVWWKVSLLWLEGAGFKWSLRALFSPNHSMIHKMCHSAPPLWYSGYFFKICLFYLIINAFRHTSHPIKCEALCYLHISLLDLIVWRWIFPCRDSTSFHLLSEFR